LDRSIFDFSANLGCLFHKIFDMVCLNAGHTFFRCRRLRLSAGQAAEKETGGCPEVLQDTGGQHHCWINDFASKNR
jgi:hypothetical protein